MKAPLACRVADISQEMAINPNDIVSTLQAMGMIKYWKGKHIILKKQVGTSRPGLRSEWNGRGGGNDFYKYAYVRQ